MTRQDASKWLGCMPRVVSVAAVTAAAAVLPVSVDAHVPCMDMHIVAFDGSFGTFLVPRYTHTPSVLTAAV